MKTYDLYFASCEPDGGIYHYGLKNGELEFVEKTPCDRPMYLNIVGNELRAVLRSPFGDSNHSGLLSYRIEEEGRLEEKSKLISTNGVVGCHLCDFAGQTYVANYLSGSVFGSDGLLDVHQGKGPHLARQEAPHVHFVSPSPDGKYLLAVDLGLDTIFVYDEALNIVNWAKVPEGHGARHLAYAEDGRFIFCVNELQSTVTVFHYEKGELTALETVPALFEPLENNTAAAIRVRGEYVYVSHRGEDSIACLRWDGEKLELCSVTKCGGAGPRDFIMVEDMIFCTNERSHTVSVLQVKGAEITDTGKRIEMGSPICVVVK